MRAAVKPSERIAQLFTSYGRDYDFYLKDLRSGSTLELGHSVPRPICSSFQLAVLLAVFDCFSATELVTPISIHPSEFRIGGGIISYFDSAVHLSPIQLLQLMLSASDATACDWLISKVGLDRVNEILRSHTQQSYVSVNLGDMVSSFGEMPNVKQRKQHPQSKSDFNAFMGHVNCLGATTARDLASLAQAVWGYQASDSLRNLYERCLKTRTRLFPRTFTFLSLPMFTKPGSIGRSLFMHDCGVVLDESGNDAVAIFAYCLSGSRLPAFMMETVGALVGLEMLRHLGMDNSPNWDWTPQTEQVFYGRILP